MTTPLHWIAAVLICGSVGACAGRESYHEPAPQTIEQQRATEAQKRRDRAAYAICKEIYGPDAVVLWTNTRDMVCRRAKPSNLL